jgi:hypothetical protein
MIVFKKFSGILMMKLIVAPRNLPQHFPIKAPYYTYIITPKYLYASPNIGQLKSGLSCNISLIHFVLTQNNPQNIPTMRIIIPTMKKPFFIFLISLISFLLSTGFSSCQKENTFPDDEPIPISLSANQKALLQNGHGFAFDLLREVTTQAGDEENVFISPLSVSLALAMTYNGAGGSTQTAMHQAMQLPELPAEKINEAWQQLMKDLLSVDKKVLLTIANSIWYDQQFHVEPPFINTNKKYYDA